jgi:hypothetical protein
MNFELLPILTDYANWKKGVEMSIGLNMAPLAHKEKIERII